MSTPLFELAARRGVAFPVHTERLSLTPFTAEDTDAVWRFNRREEVWTWTSGRPGSAEQLCEDYLAAGNRLTVQAGETIVGVGKLQVLDAWSQGGPRAEGQDALAEIGWTTDPDRAGQGYGTELAGALLEIAFTGLGVRREEAHAFADNAASRRVMEKVGLRHEATFREESLHLSRGWIDGGTYAMLASEHRGRG